MSNISLSQLLEAGVHFGHKAYRWNPKMFPYIYSEVNNIHILDLVQSATLLNEATSYLNLAASEGKIFLFFKSIMILLNPFDNSIVKCKQINTAILIPKKNLRVKNELRHKNCNLKQPQVLENI